MGKSHALGFFVATEGLKKLVAIENLCRDRKLLEVCRDREFSIVIELIYRTYQECGRCTNALSCERHCRACGTVATCRALSRQECPALGQLNTPSVLTWDLKSLS